MRACPKRSPTRLRGVTMIEVLVTIVILTFGLLGVVALQARMQVAQSESYQRSQAILLMQDIVDRVNANRSNALNYVTATPLGTGNAIQDCTGLAGAALDLCEWNNALLGTSESTAGGQSAGAMIGARGCITEDPATPNTYKVAVAWQGIAATDVPDAAATCGKDQYGDEKLRREVSTTVRIADLS